MATFERIDPQATTFARKKVKTCAYCRVSSNSADQLNSYATQVKYYTRAIQAHDEWEFVEIFADEGITGTRADKRDEFQRMIELCHRNKIELILTKSVSRFARNVPECLNYARDLRRKGIGIIFEENGINTLRMTDEMMLSVFSAIAQEESMATSQRLKHMNRERMKRGEYNASIAPYGYRYVNKELVIQEDEAEIVRWIFEIYLEGWSTEEIARELTARRIPSPGGQSSWNKTTVKYILTNEKYVGDTLLQKRFSTDTLPFCEKRNYGELEQYYVTGSHLPVVSRQLFDAVAALFKKRSQTFGHTQKSAPYPLTSKIRCGRCGISFVHKVKGGQSTWCCSNHIRSKDLCETKNQKQATIYAAFLRMFNKLYYNRKVILQGTLYQLEYAMNCHKRNNAQVVEINQSILAIMEKKHMMEQLRAKGYMADAAYLSSSRDLDKQLRSLKQEKEVLLDTKLEGAYSDIRSLLNTIEEYGREMTDFDEDIFEEIVTGCEIGADSTITFTLLGGLKFTERL